MQFWNFCNNLSSEIHSGNWSAECQSRCLNHVIIPHNCSTSSLSLLFKPSLSLPLCWIYILLQIKLHFLPLQMFQPWQFFISFGRSPPCLSCLSFLVFNPTSLFNNAFSSLCFPHMRQWRMGPSCVCGWHWFQLVNHITAVQWSTF